MAIGDRSFGHGRFDFELDGARVGYLESFKGGQMKAELAVHNQGPLRYPKKNVTIIKWEPVQIKTGMGMSRAIYEWMKSSFDLNCLYKNGAITVRDFNYRAQRRADLMNMLITEVKVPVLKGDSKEPGYFEISITPEQIRWMKEGGQVNEGPAGPKQKAWHCANWRFEMGGLDCARVHSIENISWKAEVEWDMIGTARENTLHMTAANVSDFKLTVSMADLEPWAQKAKQWFVDGKALETDEFTASLELLAPDMTEVIGRIEFLNCGFKSFDSQQELKGQAAKGIARFTTELYAEKMTFDMMGVDS